MDDPLPLKQSPIFQNDLFIQTMGQGSLTVLIRDARQDNENAPPSLDKINLLIRHPDARALPVAGKSQRNPFLRFISFISYQ